LALVAARWPSCCTSARVPSEMVTLKLLVPGHGREVVAPRLACTLCQLRSTIQSPLVEASCDVYIYGPTSFSAEGCRLIRGPGLWTDYMQRENGTEDLVLVTLDDVRLAPNFNLSAMVHTMEESGLDVVSPAYPEYFQPVMRPSPECNARRTGYMDLNVMLFKRNAWRCFQSEINRRINAIGWGYDISFGSSCNVSIGIVDTALAYHAPVPSVSKNTSSSGHTYSKRAAYLQMVAWLRHKGGSYPFAGCLKTRPDCHNTKFYPYMCWSRTPSPLASVASARPIKESYKVCSKMDDGFVWPFELGRNVASAHVIAQLH